jgi:GTP:adenosylcobinamide-phosphate guanylyltransferase
MRWSAAVLAGSRPGVDAFAAAHGTDLKALIPVGGEPMVCRPVKALLASDRIKQVRVFAQDPERIAGVLPADPRLSLERSAETIASTLEPICLDGSMAWPLLVTTADHALLTPQMIADFCDQAEGADLAIGVVERRRLLERLPETRRTWLRFRGGAYSGANLFALGGPKSVAAVELWRSVEQDRKKAVAVLAVLGPGLLVGAALRLRTVQQTAAAAGRRIGLHVRTVELSDPLAAVDVDKQADLTLAEALLAKRP